MRPHNDAATHNVGIKGQSLTTHPDTAGVDILRAPHEPWMAERNCDIDDSNYYFPGDDNGKTRRGHNAARRQAQVICAGCDVAQQCAEYALRMEEFSPIQGVWGGVIVPAKGVGQNPQHGAAIADLYRVAYPDSLGHTALDDLKTLAAVFDACFDVA